MTVSNTVVKNVYAGNGSTTVFPYTFALNTDDGQYVQVIVANEQGAETVTDNFTIDTDARNVTYPAVGDPLPTGYKIVLKRTLPNIQELNLESQGPFFAEDIEAELDRQVMMIQQLQESNDRAVKVQASSSTTPDELIDDLRQAATDAAAAADSAYNSASTASQNTLECYAINKGTDLQVQPLGLEHSCKTWNELTASNPDVSAVANDLTNIDAVASDLTYINTVAGISSDVTAVANNEVRINNVESKLTEIGICASNAINIVTCANNMPAINSAPTYAQQAQEYAQEASENAKNGHVIGEIVPVIGCTEDYIPHGCVLADGTEFSKSQFPNLWESFLTADTPLLLTCSYADYATAISTYGQCNKWAIDAVGEKFKVPTIKDGSMLQQALSNSELGKCYNPGLPNITGEVMNSTFNRNGCGESSPDSSLYWTGTNSGNYSTTGPTASNSIGFDASRSSAIYGNSATVQPTAITTRFFVCVASGAVNQSMMDWSAYMSALHGKANTDMTNIANNIDVVIDSYTDNNGNWYRVYKSGWVEQGGKTLFNNVVSVTVTFLLPFSNGDYIISALAEVNGGATNPYLITGGAAKLATSIGLTACYNNGGHNLVGNVYWYACGQGATV